MIDLATYSILPLAISQVSLNPHIHTTFTMVSIDFNESHSLLMPPVRQKRKQLAHRFPVAHQHH